MAGRPTKLTSELIEEGWKYLQNVDVSIHTLLPTIEGLAIALHISRDTIYEWEKENEAFSDIVEELRVQQGQKLIQNALLGRYNATIAKLILSGKHGYVEKTETDITTGGNTLNNINQLTDEELRARIDEQLQRRSIPDRTP
jgi:hypothetical protein